MEILLFIGGFFVFFWILDKIRAKPKKNNSTINYEQSRPIETDAVRTARMLKEEEEYRKEAEKAVKELIDELTSIGLKYVDKSKPGKHFQNMYGQDVPEISILDGKTPFYEKDMNGTSVPDQRVVQIGWALHKFGGLQLMQHAYYQVTPQLGAHGANLKWVWRNVGRWQA